MSETPHGRPDEQERPAGPPPPPPPGWTPASSGGQPPSGPPVPGGTPPPYGTPPSYGSADPTAGPAYPGSGVGRPGELVDRALARLIDFVLLAFVNGVIVGTLLVGTVLGMRGGTFGFGAGDYAATLLGTLLGTAIYLGYFTFLESSRGQTLGKMVLKLQVQAPGGGTPTVEQALRRNLFLALNLIGLVPLLGWLLAPVVQLVAVIGIAVGINSDTVRRQGWHDRFAGGTTVVKTG